MSDNANSPASPCKRHEYQIQAEGLTKREHFIAMAMQGLCANPSVMQSDISEEAILIADEVMQLMEDK